jgi:type I restriction enzyme S subunit
MSEWKTYRLGELIDVQNGYAFKSEDFSEKGVPVIKIKNIVSPRISFNECEYFDGNIDSRMEQFLVKKGDILISMIGHNRGMTAIVETDKIFSIKNVGLFKFLPHFQANKFSFYYYQSRVGLNIVLKKSKGGAQPFIGLTELRNWPVVVCSFEEQNEIVQEIESRLSVADKMEESITQSLQQAEVLRQSILKKAFEGRLV